MLEYFLRYSIISKTFRVFNKGSLKFEETVYVVFDESFSIHNQSNVNDLSIRIESIQPYEDNEDDTILPRISSLLNLISLRYNQK